MAFRLNVLIIYSLFTVALVLSRRISGKSNKNRSEPKLSDNIGNNPFLQKITNSSALNENINLIFSINNNWFPQNLGTTPVHTQNPFLSNTSVPFFSSSSNGNNQNQNTSKNDKVSGAMVNGNVAFNKHNPFLQGTPNAINPVKTDATVIGDRITSPVKTEDTSTKTKSERKCEEYARQIASTTEILSLVGATSNVITITSDMCKSENQLVVGGVTATPGEFPHMVALGIRTAEGTFTFMCGGSLLSPEWVLTAAHCTYEPRPTDVLVGFHDLTNNQRGIRAKIKNITRHPSYIPPAVYADIALIKLDISITFNKEIRPACLYQQYDTVPTKAWVSGWGVTEFGGEENSNQLQKAELDIIDNLGCARKHRTSIKIPYGIVPSMICAVDRVGGKKDTCQGDSGGPLQIVALKNSCLFQVLGITSFGQGCALGIPGVYTRVSHYLDWIEKTVWP